MNRTLVVPHFFKHHFDLTLQIHGAHGTDRDVLPPEVRVDPAAISECFHTLSPKVYSYLLNFVVLVVEFLSTVVSSLIHT